MKTLYPYQQDAVLDLVEWARTGEQRLALVMPTGAGKSLAISVFLARIRGAFLSAVVATPLDTIRTAFEAVDGIVEAEALDEPGTVSLVRDDLDGLFHRGGKATQAASLFQGHLRTLAPTAFGLVVTHHGLVGWTKKGLPKSLKRRVLIIDEAHHSDMSEDEATALGKVVKLWLARGGVVLQVTATPFRGNGIALFETADGWKVHTRPLVQHAVDLDLEFPLERHVLTTRAEKISEMDGRDVPAGDQAAHLAVEWAQKWVTDGQPKAVFIVPSLASKAWSTNLVAQLKRVAPKVRVHNAVGYAKGDKKKQKGLTDLLALEREVESYKDSKVDVIIACKRFDEGTDWKLASHVYNYSIPTSYSLILQRWGRAFRDKRKIKGYPPRFRKMAKMVFLIPKITEELAIEFEKKTHNVHSLVYCFMDNFETAAQFVGSKTRIYGPRSLDAIRDEQKHIIADQRLALARQLTEVFEVKIKAAEDRGPTMAEWKDWVDTTCPVELRQAARNVLGAKLRVKGPKVPNPADDLGEFFNQVVSDPRFRDLTFSPNAEIIASISKFTGEDVQALSRRLRGRVTVSLAEAYPEIAAQWHPTKNGQMTPDQVFVPPRAP